MSDDLVSRLRILGGRRHPEWRVEFGSTSCTFQGSLDGDANIKAEKWLAAKRRKNPDSPIWADAKIAVVLEELRPIQKAALAAADEIERLRGWLRPANGDIDSKKMEPSA